MGHKIQLSLAVWQQPSQPFRYKQRNHGNLTFLLYWDHPTLMEKLYLSLVCFTFWMKAQFLQQVQLMDSLKIKTTTDVKEYMNYSHWHSKFFIFQSYLAKIPNTEDVLDIIQSFSHQFLDLSKTGKTSKKLTMTVNMMRHV